MAFLPGVSFSLSPESFQEALLPLTSFPQFLLLLSDTVFLSAQPPLALCLSHRAGWFWLSSWFGFYIFCLQFQANSPISSFSGLETLSGLGSDRHIPLPCAARERWTYRVSEWEESSEDCEPSKVLNKGISRESATELYFLPLLFCLTGHLFPSLTLVLMEGILLVLV